ncbi:hypothetical protein TI04_05770 [Achromatium sp. WMS2]|nr:hypothetical protein TI04_05770 [Achromatium sp. WMS2]
MTKAILILCSCPGQIAAEQLAKTLVDSKYAACVTILPTVTSVYRWNDSIETANESLLLIKTNSKHYQALEDTIKQQHPYAIPEIIALPIEHGLASYLSWIEQCTDL